MPQMSVGTTWMGSAKRVFGVCFARARSNAVRRRRLLWLCFALLPLGAPRASASLVLAMELSELVAEAELVVMARVIRQESRFDDQGRIVTDVQMQVENVEKGSLAPGAGITVRRLGGTLEGLAMRIEGEPSFDDGERVLLFGSSLRRLHVYRPIGMSQGAMRVFEQNGEPWVRRANGGLSLVRKSADGRTSEAPNDATPRRLDDVLREIRDLVSKAR